MCYYTQKITMNDPNFMPVHLRERLQIIDDPKRYERKTTLTVNTGHVEGPFTAAQVIELLHSYGIYHPGGEIELGEYSLTRPEWNRWFYGWPETEPPRDLITQAAASEIAGVSISAIGEAIKKGKLHGYKNPALAEAKPGRPGAILVSEIEVHKLWPVHTAG